MKEIKVEDFKTIFNSLSEISVAAGGIFVTLTGVAYSDNPVIGKYVSTELAKMSNDKEEKITSALNELENARFIKIYKDKINLYKNRDNNISGSIAIVA